MAAAPTVIALDPSCKAELSSWPPGESIVSQGVSNIEKLLEFCPVERQVPLRSASVWKTQPDLVLVLAGQPTVVLFANDFALTTRTNVQLRISHTAGKTWSTVVPVSTGPQAFSATGRGVSWLATWTWWGCLWARC